MITVGHSFGLSDKFLSAGNTNIQIPQDLRSITYTQDQNGKKVQIQLTPEAPLDSPTVIYRSASSPVRAAVIYQDSDMSKIERVYVETPDLLYELVDCQIGKECYR